MSQYPVYVFTWNKQYKQKCANLKEFQEAVRRLEKKGWVSSDYFWPETQHYTFGVHGPEKEPLFITRPKKENNHTRKKSRKGVEKNWKKFRKTQYK